MTFSRIMGIRALVVFGDKASQSVDFWRMESEDELGEEKERTEVLKRDPRGKPDLYWILIYFFSCRFLLTSLFPFPFPYNNLNGRTGGLTVNILILNSL